MITKKDSLLPDGENEQEFPGQSEDSSPPSGARPTPESGRLVLVLVIVGSATIALVGLSLVLIHRQPRFQRVFLDVDDPLPEFDVYFTWRDFEGWLWEKPGEEEQAVFVWNGSDVGKGSTGADEIIDRLRQLPMGSRVLIFPRYRMDWEHVTGKGQSRCYPFLLLRWDEFTEVTRDKRLTLIYSALDNKGRPHPECVDPRLSGRPSGR